MLSVDNKSSCAKTKKKKRQRWTTKTDPRSPLEWETKEKKGKRHETAREVSAHGLFEQKKKKSRKQLFVKDQHGMRSPSEEKIGEKRDGRMGWWRRWGCV